MEKIAQGGASYEHTSLNIVNVIKWRMRWAEHVVCMGMLTNAYKNFSRKTSGDRPYGGTRCRWEDNIKMDLRETECEWGAFVKTVMNPRLH